MVGRSSREFRTTSSRVFGRMRKVLKDDARIAVGEEKRSAKIGERKTDAL